jgi:hypothetical protein
MICHNDSMALSALVFFHEQGRKVAQDVSLCGFDDIAAPNIFGLSPVRPPVVDLSHGNGIQTQDMDSAFITKLYRIDLTLIKKQLALKRFYQERYLAESESITLST